MNVRPLLFTHSFIHSLIQSFLMKRLFAITIMGLPLLSASRIGTAEDKVLPSPIYQKQLPNGLNVVTVPFESPGLAAFYIVMRVGSRDEIEAGKTGFAHFFEHMM